MKNLKLKIIFLLVFTSLVNQAYSQSCTDCFCGTQSSATSIGFDTLFGGRFKPSRSDIGGSPSNSAVVGLSERSERDQQQTETCFGSGMTFG